MPIAPPSSSARGSAPPRDASPADARPAGGPAGRSIRTATLQRLGLAAVGVHAVALAFAHWLLYRLVLGRTLLDLEAPLRTAFTAYTLRAFAAEIAMLAAIAVAFSSVRFFLPAATDGRRLAAAGLVSYGALAFYGLAIIGAVAFGWEPDVFVMSAADATAVEAAAAIEEALPLVLQPLAWGRLAASLAAAALFTMAQVTLCGQVRSRAVLSAVMAALLAVAVQLLVLGVPATL